MNSQDIMTVFWRDWIVLNKRMPRFILSRMISPILYLVAFGWGLGRGVQTAGGSYLDYILPGIVALNAMNISFSAVGITLSMSRIHHKTLEEYLIAPISAASFVAGKILAGSFRGILSCMVIFFVAFLFNAKIIIDLWFILILILTCFLFSALGLVVAMTIDSHEDMTNFSTYVLLPMSFICGTFFSLERLPVLVRTFIELLPLTHSAYAMRDIMSGGHPSWLSIGVLLLYTVVLIAIGTWSVKRARA